MSGDDLQVTASRFGHGYLLSRGGSVPEAAADWATLDVGAAQLRTHPRTVVSTARTHLSGRAQVVLLGQPLDVDAGTSDGGRIAASVLAALRHGLDTAVERVAGLSGRYTAILRSGSRLHVIPDSHATQPVFWTTRPAADAEVLAVASHAALAADVVGAGLDEDALALHDGIREWRKNRTIFMPGLTTTHDGVLPVFANCLLDVDLDRPSAAHHRRFWPLERRKRASVDDVASEFAERFVELTRLGMSLGRTAISLTSGLDSRMTLVAASSLARADDFAFTYVRPQDLVTQEGVRSDLFGASRLAFAAGLRHRVIQWRLPEEDDPFAVAHRQSYPGLRSSLGAATAMFHDLPHDIVELQSILAETGTYFYRRTASGPDPRAIAALTFGPPTANRPAYVAEFERLVDYTQFTRDRLLGYNWHDLTYWEHRMVKWAARKFQEGDMSHRVALPFADRRLIALMLSVPPEDRASKTLFHRFLARRPDLAAL